MIDTLKAKTLELRKARSHLASIMQFHVAEVSNIGKAKNRNTTEDEVIQYLKKTVQKLKESDFSDQEEIAVLDAMLPTMATIDQVRAHVFHLEATEGLDISNKGAVMKAVKQEFGLVDMKMVSEML
jgi:uncharacterized protein YqeY